MPSIDVSRVRWLPEMFGPMQEKPLHVEGQGCPASLTSGRVSAILVPYSPIEVWHEPPRLLKDWRTAL